jgi:hypothetical protein
MKCCGSRRLSKGLMGTVRKDAELGGTRLPAGSFLIIRYGSANRDGTNFNARPGSMSRTRRGGAPLARDGCTLCVGASLAKQEIATSFEAALDRMTDFELPRPLPEPPHRPSLNLHSLRELLSVHGTWNRLRHVIWWNLSIIKQERSLSRFILMDVRRDPTYRSTRLAELNRPVQARDRRCPRRGGCLGGGRERRLGPSATSRSNRSNA